MLLKIPPVVQVLLNLQARHLLLQFIFLCVPMSEVVPSGLNMLANLVDIVSTPPLPTMEEATPIENKTPVSETSPSNEETPLVTKPPPQPDPDPTTVEAPDSPTMADASMEDKTPLSPAQPARKGASIDLTYPARPVRKGESIDLNQTPLKDKKHPG